MNTAHDATVAESPHCKKLLAARVPEDLLPSLELMLERARLAVGTQHERWAHDALLLAVAYYQVASLEPIAQLAMKEPFAAIELLSNYSGTRLSHLPYVKACVQFEAFRNFAEHAKANRRKQRKAKPAAEKT